MGLGGSKGQKGEHGLTGPQGLKGERGVPGSAGSKGQKGEIEVKSYLTLLNFNHENYILRKGCCLNNRSYIYYTVFFPL